MSKRVKTTSNASVQFIYVGPNLPNGRLQQFSVFRGSIPAHLNDIRASRPEIDILFVPIEELSAATVATGTKGTPQYQAYQLLITSGKGA